LDFRSDDIVEGDGTLDQIDVKLLQHLEKNSRVSLKNLARDLNVKTSTIYHRLNKLKKSNILDRFTIALNPSALGLKLNYMGIVRIKKMVIGKLDAMFLESFAKYLGDQYDEIQFSGVANDEQIYIMVTVRDEAHWAEFEKQMKENPYVEAIKIIQMEKILKGNKIFTFQPNLYKIDDSALLFDDGEEESPHNGEIDEEDDNEVVF
jgi:DNA-binding Lrp family transcriptional regulator